MNEADLLQQVKNGNNDACRYLVSTYQKLVLHIVGRMIRHPEDMEDVCQEVFMKVILRAATFRGDSKLSTWIAAIAYNTSISYLKKINRRNKKHTDDMVLAEKKGIDEEIGSEMEKTELKNILLKMIESLPLNYRTVLTLYYLEEFSYMEVKQITGMPEGTVKSYLSRARNLLKQKIENTELIGSEIIYPNDGK